MTTTPNPTVEQIVAEAMVNAGAPLMHSRVEEAVASALRAAGLLGGDPTEDASGGDCRGYCEEDGTMPCEEPIGGFMCTRSVGHEGVHVACSADEHDLTGALTAAAGVAPQAHANAVDMSSERVNSGPDSSHVAPQEPSARVVTRGSDTDCASGICLGACSHLMWQCDRCSSEGGWGAPRDLLEQWAADHVCPTLCIPSPNREKTRIEASNQIANIVFDQVKRVWPDLHPLLDLRYGIADAVIEAFPVLIEEGTDAD